METNTFHVPTVPYGIVDALNRRAVAVGSALFAKRSSHADYNGHAVNVWWNDYRGYYIAEYTWSGRQVMARGTLQSCLNAALNYHRRGALGAKVSVCLRDDDTEGQALCEATSELQTGAEPDLDWHTWRHTTAARCARDAARPGVSTMVFDLELLEAAADERAYTEALKTKHGHVYA